MARQGGWWGRRRGVRWRARALEGCCQLFGRSVGASLSCGWGVISGCRNKCRTGQWGEVFLFLGRWDAAVGDREGRRGRSRGCIGRAFRLGYTRSGVAGEKEDGASLSCGGGVIGGCRVKYTTGQWRDVFQFLGGGRDAEVRGGAERWGRFRECIGRAVGVGVSSVAGVVPCRCRRDASL